MHINNVGGFTMKTIIMDDNIKEIVGSMIEQFGYDINDIVFKQGYKESIINRTADIWLSKRQFACLKKFLALIGEQDFIITQMDAFNSACKLDTPVYLVDSDVKYDEYYNLPLMDTSIAFSKNANWAMCIEEGVDYGAGIIAVKDDLLQTFMQCFKM